MNPEEIIARESERLGRPLTAEEKAAIRRGTTSLVDGIRATPLPVSESAADRTAREARESAAERDAVMAARSGRAPTRSGLPASVEDWIGSLPSHLRDAGDTLDEWVPTLGAPARALAEAADADDEEVASRARSMASGAVEGATLGFGDELAGAVGTLAGRDYEEGRDAVRARMRAAFEENPRLYGGSALVTGAAVPIPGLGGATGGVTRATGAIVPRVAGGVARAARAGGAAGMIAGAGMSDSDLTEDASGLLSDAVEGGLYGAGTGAAVGAVPEIARGIAETAPSVRARADRAVMAVPSRSSAGGADLLEEMAGPNPSPEARREAAETVRGVVRRAGWFPSSEDIARATDEALANGGPSRPFEERLEGARMSREELAAILRRRAAAGERSATEAAEMAPLRAAADRTFSGSPPPPAPAPPPAAAPSAPVARPAPPPAAPTVRPAGRPTRAPGAVTAPRRPGAVPDDTLAPIDPARGGTLPPPVDGTVPPGVGLEDDPADLAAWENRMRAHRAGRAAPAAEPGTAARPGRGRRSPTVPAAPPPEPAGPPVPRPGERPALDTMTMTSLRAPSREPTIHGSAMAPEVPRRPPAFSPLPDAPTPTYREPSPPAVRPRAERPLGARRLEPGAVPGLREEMRAAGHLPVGPDSVPVYSRPERGRIRSAPGSALYEMRAWRERGFPAPMTRRGPAEHGWRGAGADLRERIDDMYRRRHGTAGPEGLDAYRAARRVEEAEIPIRRSAEAGAARDAGRSLIPARDVMMAHAASAMGAGPMAASAIGAGAGALDRVRGPAVRERLLDTVARGLESRTARDLAAGDGSSVRRGAGAAGEAAAVAHERPEPETPDLRTRLADRLRPAEPEPDVYTTGPATAAPPTGSPPASSPVPPPSGGATTPTTSRRRPSGTLRERLAGRRRH